MTHEQIDALIKHMKDQMEKMKENPALAHEFLIGAGLLNKDGTPSKIYHPDHPDAK